MNVWELSQKGYHPQKAEENGNRFFTGNGFVGVRGTLDEFRKEHFVAWNLAGVYDRSDESAWREPINAPKGLYYKRTEEQYITKATIIFLFTLSELKRKRVPQKSLKQC